MLPSPPHSPTRRSKNMKKSTGTCGTAASHPRIMSGKVPKKSFANRNTLEYRARLRPHKSKQNTSPRLIQPTHLVHAFQSARKRLFLFDYDGTLTPIVANPADAKPTPALLQFLQCLCDNPANTVWVVSGRDQATLEAWLGGIRGLGLSAEHGSFMRQPGQEWVDMLTQKNGLDWKPQAIRVFENITAETPGTVVEEKKSSVTWHYRNALDPQQALEHCERAYEMLKSQLKNVDVLRGKMNLEVRSARVNKGQVVRAIQQQVQADFVLCAGDDRTDEDMFVALANAPGYCVSIGPQERDTVAAWYMDTPEAFVGCIGHLVVA